MPEPIKVKRDERQASVFCLVIFRHAKSRILSLISSSFLLCGIDLSYMAYTDDLLLLSRLKADLQHNLNRLKSEFRSIGRFTNIDKYKFLK